MLGRVCLVFSLCGLREAAAMSLQIYVAEAAEINEWNVHYQTIRTFEVRPIVQVCKHGSSKA